MKLTEKSRKLYNIYKTYSMAKDKMFREYCKRPEVE